MTGISRWLLLVHAGLAIGAGWSGPVLAEPTLADYGNLPAIQMLSISPDGNVVAFRRTNAESDQVLVVSIARNKVLRRTDVSSVSPRYMHFISNDELVLVASELRKVFGFRGDLDVSTAFVMEISSGDIRQLLTPGDNIFPGQTGLGRIVGVSSDKRHLYMPAFVSDKLADRSPEFSLMKVDIESPRKPLVVERGRSNTVDYFTGRNDRLLAMETYSNNSDHHQVLVRKGGDWRPIFEDETNVMKVSFSGVTPDESSLVMLEQNSETGRISYSSISLHDGTVSGNLFDRDDADVETVLTDINRVTQGVVFSGFNPSYRFFDPSLDARVNAIVAQFPRHSVWLRDWSDDLKHLVVYVEGPSLSGDFFLFSEGQEARFLTAARPNITADDINPTTIVEVSARDGLSIPTILTLPRQHVDSARNLPAILLPHGGPESYDRIEFNWLAQAFASQGYLVIQPQFRGSEGFGAEHLRAGHGEWGKKMQDDLTDTLLHLIEKNLVDETRVCALGASYGGYAALAGGAFTPELFRCVVSLNGVSDLPGMLAYERRRYGSKHWVVSYFENLMVSGAASKDKLNAISPARFADAFTAPVLLLHGENDTTVPYEQSEEMYDSLRKAGKDVRLVNLDDNHYLAQSEHRLAALREMVTFVNQHIGANANLSPD